MDRVPTSQQHASETESEMQDAWASAAALQRLGPARRGVVFRLLPPDRAHAVFDRLDAALQEELLRGLEEGEVRQLIEEMEPDDRARLFAEMPATVVRRALDSLSPQERALTDLLLRFPPESAGRVMSPEFVALRPDLSAVDALSQIRDQGLNAATVYTLPVIGQDKRLEGVVQLRDLVLAAPEQTVAALMDRAPRTVRADEDQEVASRLVQATGLPAVPVLDQESQLVGLLTSDDAMEILEREEEEDLAHFSGTSPLGRPYFSASVFRLARRRVLWLVVLSVAAVLTVNVLAAFEETLQSAVSLALFIPFIIGIGGNCGSQSATTIVRGLAVGEVQRTDLVRVVVREGTVGLLLGAMLSGLAFAVLWLFVGPTLGAVVASTILVVCGLATAVGALMPLVARQVGIDPAVASAPFVTTVVDAAGLLVYLGIAKALLGL